MQPEIQIQTLSKLLVFLLDTAQCTSAQYWPESSALGNAADFCLTTLPMALSPVQWEMENFFFEILVGSGIQFRQWLVYIDFLIDSHKELFSFFKKSIFVLPPWCLTLSSHVCSRMGRGHNCWRQGCWSCNTNNNSHSISTNISSINVAWA